MSTKAGDEFLTYVMDILSSLHTIKERRMFGGYGLYINGRIFGLIVRQELYFKANDKAREFFMQFDSEQFAYERKNKIITMSYWKVPAAILEDQVLLERWLSKSLES